MATFTWYNGNVPANLRVTQVYGLIFTKDGRLLLKVENKNNGKMYSLAGGKPEVFDNSLEDTLKRELLEEINTTVTNITMLGYQLVDEENGIPPYAQVRMTAIIDNIGEVKPDPDNGKTYDRLLISPTKAISLLNWGEVGRLQIEAASVIAENTFNIELKNDKSEYV